MSDLIKIAEQIFSLKEKVCLIYAFNATGKTRLSVAYKDLTKSKNAGKHSGVYFNAFSEDLFVWDNDEEHYNENIKLNVVYSTLNQFHSLLLDTDLLGDKLAFYHPRYKFNLDLYEDGDREKGIFSITFYLDEETQKPIKISRGEERIFIWCLFLALFETDAWTDVQDAHFFIDDPVSSLDEHNIFITAESIFNLIEDTFPKKQIIVTTHHIGLFSILSDRLTKGEKSGRYRENTKQFILGKKDEKIVLKSHKKDVFLFHLHLLQVLDEAIKTELFAYHFVLLRQLLENISSFLGKGGISYALDQIGLENVHDTGNIINSLSHKDAYRLQSNKMSEIEENIFKDVFQKIQVKYDFKF